MALEEVVEYLFVQKGAERQQLFCSNYERLSSHDDYDYPIKCWTVISLMIGLSARVPEYLSNSHSLDCNENRCLQKSNLGGESVLTLFLFL
jgi:hypothetical protein